MRRQEITKEQYNEIVSAEKETQDKSISRKLKVLMFRYEGYDNDTIAVMTGMCSVRVSQLVSEYLKNGLEAYTQRKYGGNHRNMSEAEESEILSKFKAKAESGQVITAQEIKKAFDERLGRDTGRGYIYMLLARHGWRKVMPRSKHPQRADDATIEASKKLKAR